MKNDNENNNRKIEINIKQRAKRIIMQSGITMIASIVTIIILLILAGVTINMATSGSGIFGRAKNAANIYIELEGTIEIDANPSIYVRCFAQTALYGKGLVLTGKSNMLNELLNTKSANANIVLSSK